MTEGADEWGPWRAHDGRGCPCREGEFVEVRLLGGGRFSGLVEHRPARSGEVNIWCHIDCLIKAQPGLGVILYRVRAPRALRGLRALVEGVREREDFGE